jgi:hypothetical protein
VLDAWEGAASLRRVHRLTTFFCFFFLACGSHTGLSVPEVGEDAEVEDVPVVPDVFDASPDTLDAGPACIPFRTRADLASLDIFVLLDSSGSMEQVTASGLTKAEAVSEALIGFIEAPESTGVGVGLSFFPIEDTSVPSFCTGDAQCGGDVDSCFAPDVCIPGGTLCREGSMCDDGATCEPLGRCAGRRDFNPCFPVDSICDGGDRCIDAGLCENRTSCAPDDYARPTVDLGLLPGVGSAIVRALETQELGGSTPTLPALAGALDRARARGLESPGSKVIVLLATDGFPAACDDALPDPFDEAPDASAGIPAVVSVAQAGVADGIDTFVVGVFEPEQEAEARENFVRIAEAGGTEEALVISTEDDVTVQLLEALNALRAGVRTCVYAIPAEGAVPDPRDLQVRLLQRGDATELNRVVGLDGCDRREGGFFFQQDIEDGARPGYVELCPSSCAPAARPEVTVEMQAGCRD